MSLIDPYVTCSLNLRDAGSSYRLPLPGMGWIVVAHSWFCVVVCLFAQVASERRRVPEDEDAVPDQGQVGREGERERGRERGRERESARERE